MTTRSLAFIGRLAVPTVMMGIAVAYWVSLLDARMRDQNIILIQPVVGFIAICYVAVIIFEIRKFTQNSPRIAPEPGAAATHIKFMAVAVVGAALFPLFGAIPATVAMLAGGIYALGVKNPFTIAATAVVTTAVLWAVFIKGFGMRMTLFSFLG